MSIRLGQHQLTQQTITNSCSTYWRTNNPHCKLAVFSPCGRNTSASDLFLTNYGAIRQQIGFKSRFKSTKNISGSSCDDGDREFQTVGAAIETTCQRLTSQALQPLFFTNEPLLIIYEPEQLSAFHNGIAIRRSLCFR